MLAIKISNSSCFPAQIIKTNPLYIIIKLNYNNNKK